MNRVLIRVIGAPLLLAGLALCVYADYARKTTTAVTVLIACFACISFRELCEMARLKGIRPAEILGFALLLVSFALALGIQVPGIPWIPITLVFLFLLLLRCVLFPRFSSPVDVGYTYLACNYVLLLIYIFEVGALSPGEWMYWLLFLVATNKGSDMAAYVVGKSIGRHRLAPTISPNKTWEGSAGGLVAGTILGFLVLRLWKSHGGHDAVIARDLIPGMDHVGLYLGVAAAVTVAAQLGDLVKSAIKRWAGVKDSGHFLPEFGGALDMVDSFILSAPVAHFMFLTVFPRVMAR
jgi:phosphatidate cytidylyltransferase